MNRIRRQLETSTSLKMLNISTASKHVFQRISSCLRKISSTTSIQVQVRRLEVERKFSVTPVVLSYLRSNGGGSSFKKHESLKNQTIHDIYHDRNGLLFSKGVYIRQRNGHWEAKIRTGGDFINSAFTEIDGNDAVKEVVKQHLTVSVDSIEEMLKPCAEFVTERESWMIDGRFKVDVDSTDFGHMVGEVELTEMFQYTKDNNGQEEWEEEKALREMMEREIKAFMQSYPQAFLAERPLGKLSAYFHKFGYRM